MSYLLCFNTNYSLVDQVKLISVQKKKKKNLLLLEVCFSSSDCTILYFVRCRLSNSLLSGKNFQEA